MNRSPLTAADRAARNILRRAPNTRALRKHFGDANVQHAADLMVMKARAEHAMLKAGKGTPLVLGGSLEAFASDYAAAIVKARERMEASG